MSWCAVVREKRRGRGFKSLTVCDCVARTVDGQFCARGRFLLTKTRLLGAKVDRPFRFFSLALLPKTYDIWELHYNLLNPLPVFLNIRHALKKLVGFVFSSGLD